MDSLVDFLLNFYGPTPYALIFGILLLCGLGLPIPEDVTLFAAGVLSYYGITNLWLTIGLCIVGVLMGDSTIFFLGSRFGRKLTRRWFFAKLLPEERLNAVAKKFKKRGNRLIFAARFMPGLRAPIFFSAGLLHLPYRVFLFYDGSAALISVPTIIGAVYLFGEKLDSIIRRIQKLEHGVMFVAFVSVAAMAGKWYITHRKLKRG